ncbi:hypothetical protein [Endozoicomonas sp.]|uniref:hypothetical protein n=1 Tax=Endozoicomonas sp. TaxID=1892382 RepID=UPI0028842BB2|nr:hypothetical protein [Endozoicomonas sp.]
MIKTWLYPLIVTLSLGLLANTAMADLRVDNRQDNRQDKREDKRLDDRQDKRWNDQRRARIQPVIVPRRRTINNVVVFRPYGKPYAGYGRYHNDNDAVKWLAFTAITLKILDNINEAAQREHETAQVTATTAPIGEKVIWNDGNASGYVVATKQGKSSTTGLVCREFQQSVTIGGETEDAWGQACLQADGSWKIVQ